MRTLCCVALALAFVGCKKNDAASDSAKAADSAAAAAPAPAATPAAPKPIALADVAGKWTLRTMPAGKDTVLVTCQLTATADTTGWSQTCNGQKIPLHVSAAGDSIMLHAGPYPSVLRKGVQVVIDGASRLQGDKLVGTLVAHYQGAKAGADSVLHLRSEGTRSP